MAENYNAPLLAPGQPNEAYQAQPIHQPQYAAAQYAQPAPHYVQQPYYGQPMNAPPNQPVYAHPYDPNQPAYVQPMAPQVVVLAHSNPGQPGHIQTLGTFSDGLFDCFNAPMICLTSLFVPCYRWPTTIARLGMMSLGTAVGVYGGCMLASWICSVVYAALYPRNISDNQWSAGTPTGAIILQIISYIAALVLVYMGATYRKKIRERYNIHGSSFGDVMTYLCCSCCAMSQEARHVDRDYGLMV